MLKEAAHLSLQFYLHKNLKPCLLTDNMQKCAVRRSSMTRWVARGRKFTAVGVDGPGFYFVWVQVFPLHNNDPFPWRIIVWAGTSASPQASAAYLSSPESCEGVSGGIFLGAEASHGVWGGNGDPGP